MPMPPRPTALMIPMVTVCRKAKRIADREHDVAGARFLAISKRDRRQIFLPDLQQCNVGARIGPDFFCLVFAELGAQSHHDFLRARNDMIGSKNKSIRADDHTGAKPLQRLFTLPLQRLSPEKLT